MTGTEQGTFKSSFLFSVDNSLIDHRSWLFLKGGEGLGEEGKKVKERVEMSLKLPLGPTLTHSQTEKMDHCSLLLEEGCF